MKRFSVSWLLPIEPDLRTAEADHHQQADAILELLLDAESRSTRIFDSTVSLNLENSTVEVDMDVCAQNEAAATAFSREFVTDAIHAASCDQTFRVPELQSLR
jgi:hypothetical protein